MAGCSSPDSSASISSLLASCSLGSSSSSSRPFPSVIYKDRLYDSASKALEAYIEDYEQNLQSPVSTGKITLSTSSRPRPVTRRDPQVKGERISSLRSRVARDPDLLSLTTDDLLCFPSDGSLPVSHTRLSGHKHVSSRRKHNGSTSRKPAPLASHPVSSLNGTPKLSLLDLQPQDCPDVFKEKRKPRYIPYGMSSENQLVFNNKNTSKCSLKSSTLPKNYPRWLTSKKSELSVSGLTSVPDVKYPVWLNTHNLLSDSDSDALSKGYKTLGTGCQPHIAKKVHSVSFTRRMNNLHIPQAGIYGDNEGIKNVTLDNVANINGSSNRCKHLEGVLRDDSVEVIHHSSKSINDFGKKDSTSPVLNGSPRTEEILEGERSWEKLPFLIKSPVPVLCEEDEQGLVKSSGSNLEAFLSDCAIKKKELATASTFSGGRHHGPVEALKHMLFNLQSFQHDFNEGKNTEPGKEGNRIPKEGNSSRSPLEQEVFPVNKSLQKAMHHLSRLKELVGDSNVKPDKEKDQEPQ